MASVRDYAFEKLIFCQYPGKLEILTEIAEAKLLALEA